MKKIIAIMTMLVSLATHAAFASKIAKDVDSNETYAQKEEWGVEGVIDNYLVLCDEQVKLMNTAIAKYKLGQISDEQADKIIKINDKALETGKAFWEYVKIYDKVQAGELKPNAYNNRRFCWLYNQYVLQYRKLVKAVEGK